ncbi:unnamed protein product, partial [Meganyctiphanes norvegica]
MNITDVLNLHVTYICQLLLSSLSGRQTHVHTCSVSHLFAKIVREPTTVKEAAGFLRIGSLNVKVRKTTEAFNNLLARDTRDVEARLHKNWGSSDSLPDAGQVSSLTSLASMWRVEMDQSSKTTLDDAMSDTPYC